MSEYPSTDAEIEAWIDRHGVYHPEAIALIGGSMFGGGIGERSSRRNELRATLKRMANRRLSVGGQPDMSPNAIIQRQSAHRA
jgi:hypothetical protein